MDSEAMAMVRIFLPGVVVFQTNTGRSPGLPNAPESPTRSSHSQLARGLDLSPRGPMANLARSDSTVFMPRANAGPARVRNPGLWRAAPGAQQKPILAPSGFRVCPKPVIQHGVEESNEGR